jgi:hypothetical protein
MSRIRNTDWELDCVTSCLEDLVGPEEGAALHVEDAALVVVLELLEMVDGELVSLRGLLVQG